MVMAETLDCDNDITPNDITPNKTSYVASPNDISSCRSKATWSNQLKNV